MSSKPPKNNSNDTGCSFIGGLRDGEPVTELEQLQTSLENPCAPNHVEVYTRDLEGNFHHQGTRLSSECPRDIQKIEGVAKIMFTEVFAHVYPGIQPVEWEHLGAMPKYKSFRKGFLSAAKAFLDQYV